MKSIKKVVALLLVSALVIGVTGCGTGGSSSTASSDNKVRVAMQDPNVPIDPQKQTNSYLMMVADQVVEPLINLDNDGNLSPLLIKEMPKVSADGLTYSFELKDAKFHNGEMVKSSDVKYSFERLLTKGVMGAMVDQIQGAQGLVDKTATSLEGFKIIDDKKFDLVLEQPYSPFTSALATTYVCVYPEKACEEAGADWGRTVLYGTGPYKMDKFTAGQGIEVSKFDDYHGEKAKNNGVSFKFIEDMNTQVMEYQKGNVDVLQLDATLYPNYKDTAEIKDDIHSFNPIGLVYLAPNMELTADPKVREALTYAIDRKTICEDLLHGTATPAKTFIPKGLVGYDDSVPDFEYNPAKAKQILTDAGYADGVTIEMPVSTKYSFLVKVATAIQDQAKAAGININITQVDGAAYSDMAKGGTVPLAISNWYVDYIDPDGMIYQRMSSTTTMHNSSSKYNNPEFNALIDEARTITDEAKRQELYSKADKILTRQDYGAVPILNETKFYLSKPYVKNFKVTDMFRFHFNTAEL
ncbi:MAG: ABC transporter substrate-binding protein, partial [Eubacterium sp.]